MRLSCIHMTKWQYTQIRRAFTVFGYLEFISVGHLTLSIDSWFYIVIASMFAMFFNWKDVNPRSRIPQPFYFRDTAVMAWSNWCIAILWCCFVLAGCNSFFFLYIWLPFLYFTFCFQCHFHHMTPIICALQIISESPIILNVSPEKKYQVFDFEPTLYT